MALRKLVSLVKDWKMLLFVIAMPCLQIVLFGIAIGNDPTGIQIAVVNQVSRFGPSVCLRPVVVRL